MKKWFLALLWCIAGGLWIFLYATDSAGTSGAGTAYLSTDTVTSPDSQIVSPESTHPDRTSSGKITSEENCINVNNASAADLQKLPGVGPVIAERIMDYRKQHGVFKSVSDLDKVKGLGPAKLKKISARVCF